MSQLQKQICHLRAYGHLTTGCKTCKNLLSHTSRKTTEDIEFYWRTHQAELSMVGPVSCLRCQNHTIQNRWSQDAFIGMNTWACAKQKRTSFCFFLKLRCRCLTLQSKFGGFKIRFQSKSLGPTVPSQARYIRQNQRSEVKFWNISTQQKKADKQEFTFQTSQPEKMACDKCSRLAGSWCNKQQQKSASSLHSSVKQRTTEERERSNCWLLWERNESELLLFVFLQRNLLVSACAWFSHQQTIACFVFFSLWRPIHTNGTHNWSK